MNDEYEPPENFCPDLEANLCESNIPWEDSGYLPESAEGDPFDETDWEEFWAATLREWS
jgi:hypothetical protein